LPEFKKLPFNERPHLMPYLIHLTRGSISENNRSAFDNLMKILRDGKIRGNAKGCIKGPYSACCFMDVPFASLKYVLRRSKKDTRAPSYEPYGLFVQKQYAYKKGARPVLYLSNDEMEDLSVPGEARWRVVRLDVKSGNWISWLHEREWRCLGDFCLPKRFSGVLVKTLDEVEELYRVIENSPNRYKVFPRCILPLDVICQGLVYWTP
jgi:hypothetical protein